MSRPRLTRAELIAEFHRVGGSGRPEEQIGIPAIRRQLARSRRAHLKSRRAPPRARSSPTVDLKKLQANDLD
ncbi:hypothetical protein [Ralstonia solanacearum]|uniref:Uncharacterized protein n=1 Tax=Ralstonia solanacearum TaxID=305 RepID=A0AAE3T6Y6_RALSL|nr:hypothetical protein [Ralstonia solanacearum]MBB6581636.1 hypothetical protein [Ralstonia solanacearum]MDB0523784.1 hypothetical protein [Ralstonia solanacearum]